jgi:hypothetical protein
MKYVNERTIEIVEELGKLEMASIDNLEGTMNELEEMGFNCEISSCTDYLLCKK